MQVHVSPPVGARQFVSGVQATRIGGVSRYELMRLAALGKVRVQAEPGRNLKFNAADLLALANANANA